MTPPSGRTLVKLRRALRDLPPPWATLCNRRPSADGPPWVKFLVFHPEKGIALVDAAPAGPQRAIAPLEEFLARTGLAAFADGDPPIVAVALDLSDLPDIGARLAGAFASAPPCGIANENWPEALMDLLTMTPRLSLAPLIARTPEADPRRYRPPQPAPMARSATATPRLVAARAVRGWVTATSQRVGAAATITSQRLAAGAMRLSGAAATVAAVAFRVITLATRAALRSAVHFSRRTAIATQSLGTELIAAARPGSRAVAQSIAATIRATIPLARAGFRGAAVIATRAGVTMLSRLAALAAGAGPWGRATARWTAMLSRAAIAGSHAALGRTAAISRRVVMAARLRVQSPIRIRMNPAASLAIGLALATLSWIGSISGPTTVPGGHAAATTTSPPVAATDASLVAASGPTQPALRQAPLSAQFEIGDVSLRFDPPSSYCLYPDPLLQTVVAWQGKINPDNVVHTVFGDCDQLQRAVTNPERIRDYGMLMTPRAQLTQPIDKSALDRIVARAVDRRMIKETLDQRLHQAQSKLTLQAFSTLGILQRDQNATYFAYLFKTSPADGGGYNQACVMALTTVKGRLVAYYLYSDYTRDARATLMGLLQRVRTSLSDLQAQNS